MTMPPKDLKKWAKEELIDAIDCFLVEYMENNSHDVDDEEELILQRNRVAKLFKMKEKTRNKIMYPFLNNE